MSYAFQNLGNEVLFLAIKSYHSPLVLLFLHYPLILLCYLDRTYLCSCQYNQDNHRLSLFQGQHLSICIYNIRREIPLLLLSRPRYCLHLLFFRTSHQTLQKLADFFKHIEGREFIEGVEPLHHRRNFLICCFSHNPCNTVDYI